MKLLLVEDERDFSKALTNILKKKGFDVSQAFDGEEGYLYINNYDFDVCILDVMMPKMNGIELLKKIRTNKYEIPIIMLTAKSEIDDKVLGLNMGADDYLTKPFSTKELLARINSITRRKAGQFNKLEFKGLILDANNLLITYNDNSVRLTNKEFQIMEMLMNNLQCVISTEKFMDKIWEYDSNAEMSVVWVYISNLRKKLKDLNAKIEIKSYRGVGYALEGKNE